MVSKEKNPSADKAGVKQKSPTPAVDGQTHQESPLEDIVQRARSNPRLLTPKDVLQLQRTGGNQAVSNLLSNATQPANQTGLPGALKTGIEDLSGFSLDDVKVHYNSYKPAQLNALAYTQGSEIHVAPGQEKHLPHETWHVVQQKQGRVKPTFQLKNSVNVNDDAGLENEADVMGAKALAPAAQITGGPKGEELLQGNPAPVQRMGPVQSGEINHTTDAQRELADAVNHSPRYKEQQASIRAVNVSYGQSAPPIQRVRERDFVADPEDFMSKNMVLFNYGKGFSLRYPLTVGAIGSRIPENNLTSNVKLLMAKNKDIMCFYLQDSGTKAQDDKSIYFTTPAIGLLPDTEIKSIFTNGDTPLADADDLVATLKKEDGGGDNIRANYAPYFIDNPNLKKDGSGAKDADTWDNVGHTVVDPRVTKFVFTDTMNGCAYAITKVEGDKVKFEAWHFQNESDNFDQASHFRATKEIRDWFGVNDYYIGDGSTNLATTNIIWNSDGGTKMLSQKNIVPLKSGEPSSFQESTSHDLNVSEDLQEEQLVGIHNKLKRGIRNFVKQADINILNQQIQALTVNVKLANKSMERVRVEETAMSAAEVKEINHLPDNIAKNKVHANVYPVDLAMFDEMEGLKQALVDISSPGIMFGTNYAKEKTIPLKKRFLNVSTGLFSKVSALVDEAKQIVVTTSSDELNQDLTDMSFKIKFYLDIYEEYGADFQRVEDVLGRLKRLENYKKAITRKNTTLAAEKESLFPS